MFATFVGLVPLEGGLASGVDAARVSPPLASRAPLVGPYTCTGVP